MSDYFSHARREIAPHLPAKIDQFLDVGCGNGTTSAFIRHLHPEVRWAGGVELFAEAAEKARSVLDEVWCGDLEATPFETEIAPASLDAILCLDVLEHLVDPWTVVKRLSPLLAEDGRLIISIPNIRNWKFIRKLLMNGDFHYRDAGLLDRTHLRFFTRATMFELFQGAGFRIEQGFPRIFGELKNENVINAIRLMAAGVGADPDLALQDAMPLQYVVKAVPV